MSSQKPLTKAEVLRRLAAECDALEERYRSAVSRPTGLKDPRVLGRLHIEVDTWLSPGSIASLEVWPWTSEERRKLHRILERVNDVHRGLREDPVLRPPGRRRRLRPGRPNPAEWKVAGPGTGDEIRTGALEQAWGEARALLDRLPGWSVDGPSYHPAHDEWRARAVGPQPATRRRKRRSVEVRGATDLDVLSAIVVLLRDEADRLTR